MKLRACLLVSFVIFVTSCVNDRRYSHPHGMPPGQVKKVVHCHSNDCGHFFVDGVWIIGPAKPGRGHMNSPPGWSTSGPKKGKKPK